MRIKSIEANNFKSLVDFKIDLGPFNGLIGLNGSGKSTVLQFVDFASQLIKGNITEWLKERKWQPSDLKSKLTKKGNIDLKISFANKKGQEIGYWSANYNPSMKHCTQERIQFLQSSLEVKKGVVYITLRQNSNNESNSKIRIPFEYEGSILSALKEDLLPRSVLKCKSFLKNMNSLDLLSPEHLRQRTRESSGALGLGGQKLSSFLYELGRVKREDLTSRLRYVYPQLLSVGVKSLRSGWKQLEISEEYDGMEAGMRGFFPIMRTEARHVNDGMLRLITILAELQSKHSLLLFDEIENGINPEAVEFIIDTLTNSDKQVIVTTHSPMILNYLNDEIAKSGIVYLYKTSIGISKAIQFFTIPSIAEKLTVMGPGEVFVDTNLTELDKEIQTLDLKGE
ncbi:AAA family ATPase [Desulfobacter vibrioformis]|uniref:AAA family ATPase n=1 Tax=Desulfobacter vibrioformis TaxID=34031 RepID=UPI000556E19C|nr:ATP-binding protein [Desulfobacter vibrioformis]